MAKPNKRHSAPAAAAGSASSQMMQWGPQMFYPWGQPMAMPGPAFSQQPTKSPWDTDSDSEGDFQQTKKKCKTLPKPSPSQFAAKGKKRGPGRPSKKELEEQEKMKNYLSTIPKILDETKVVIAIDQKDDCRCCRIYKGNFAFVPCGHGFYCPKCINKKRMEWMNLKRPAKCYDDDCYDLVDGWLK